MIDSTEMLEFLRKIRNDSGYVEQWELYNKVRIQHKEWQRKDVVETLRYLAKLGEIRIGDTFEIHVRDRKPERIYKKIKNLKADQKTLTL